jgi:hypothetical protein
MKDMPNLIHQSSDQVRCSNTRISIIFIMNLVTVQCGMVESGALGAESFLSKPCWLKCHKYIRDILVIIIWLLTTCWNYVNNNLNNRLIVLIQFSLFTWCISLDLLINLLMSSGAKAIEATFVDSAEKGKSEDSKQSPKLVCQHEA